MLAHQEKEVFDATRTTKHPNGHFVQINSAHELKCMPENGRKCAAQFIAVVVDAFAVVRSGSDQSTIIQT